MIHMWRILTMNVEGGDSDSETDVGDSNNECGVILTVTRMWGILTMNVEILTHIP